MKRKIRNAKPRPLLKALFRGEDLRGFIEASRTRTLDKFVGGENQNEKNTKKEKNNVKKQC